MGNEYDDINTVRDLADRFRKDIDSFSRQKQFDRIIDGYERIFEELMIELNRK